jgi:hypothetical protein
MIEKYVRNIVCFITLIIFMYWVINLDRHPNDDPFKGQLLNQVGAKEWQEYWK